MYFMTTFLDKTWLCLRTDRTFEQHLFTENWANSPSRQRKVAILQWQMCNFSIKLQNLQYNYAYFIKNDVKIHFMPCLIILGHHFVEKIKKFKKTQKNPLLVGFF